MKEHSFKELIKDELKKLKPKEKTVLQGRFGLNGKQQTLAAIGRQLKLSRERIRQIEKEALEKLSVAVVKNHRELADKIHHMIEKNGGVVNKKNVVELVMPGARDLPTDEEKSLHLFMELLPEIEKIERHNDIHDSWILAKVPKEEMVQILKDWAKYLKEHKTPKSIEVLVAAHPDHRKHDITFLSSLPKVSKSIIETYEGTVGLSEWPEINPKTVKDKIFYVLKKNQKPMHFTKIAQAIRNEQFDKKRVVPATVHNELISDKRYVLIGRGIYALEEWGYWPGTVKDVIRKILQKSKTALGVDEIYDRVLKQRKVRKNTVLINLQTNGDFKKVSKDKYSIA